MRRLLLVDPGGGVALSDLDGRALVELAEGGTPQPTAVRARTAVWSAAGQWAAVALGSDAFDGPQEVRLHRTGEDTAVLVPQMTAFYLCPSPSGSHLSHLSPGPLGLELAISDVATGELRLVERGQPLFWSWSPDGTRIAVHVGDRVLSVPVDGGEAEVLTERAASFIVPWWMPDGSVVIASEDGIVCHGPDRSVTSLVEAGAGRFALDPDGRRLAIVDLLDDQPCLVVVDLLTGERDVVARERTAAFFWSPEGRRLAALVLAGPSQLQWVVSGGEQLVRLAPFRPATGWLREVLPFFEQYAQSHAVWSPDGTELVAPGLDADGSTAAIVQGVDAPATAEQLPGVRLAWWAG